ncbi:MAG: hypothetical protein AAF612_12305 [Planctomycetota bacterium]
MADQQQSPYEAIFGERAEEAHELLRSRVLAYSLMGWRLWRQRRTGVSWRKGVKAGAVQFVVFLALAGGMMLLLFATPLHQALVYWVGSPGTSILVYAVSALVGVGAARVLRARGLRSPVYTADPPRGVVLEAARDAVLNDLAFRKAKFTPLCCLHCGYDLRGSDGDRCVECGKALLGRASEADVMRDIRFS